MHWIVPFAAPLPAAGSAALAAAAMLQLPALQAWLARAGESARDDGDGDSYSPPHERARAQVLGIVGGDGRLPWAAHALAAAGHAPGELAWGLVTPAHWHLGSDQVSLVDPSALALDEAASRALLAAVEPLFTGAGHTVRYGAPLVWYTAHDALAGLRTASLDRVVGRNVDAWLDAAPATRHVRRLQSEVQMLLYTHPINDRREADGLLPVNSFWLSGCGVAQAAAGSEPLVDDALRAPALASDWPAWAAAWAALDARIATAPPTRLTLCGERSSATFDAADGHGLRRRWRAWASPLRPAALLETL